MASDSRANDRSGSTTWEWRKTKVRGPRPEGQHDERKRGRFHGLARRNRSSRLTLTVSHKGGSESWWLVEARGRTAAFPGHRAIEDVMAEVNQDWAPPH